MPNINISKLERELRTAGIKFAAINSNGWVHSEDATHWIHERPDVAAIIAAHDPTPDPEPPSLQERLEAAELFLGLLLDQEVTR